MQSFRKELQDRIFQTDNEIAAGLFAIAFALENLTTQVKYLGVGDASSTMGAIEFLATNIGDKIQDAGNEIARAITQLIDKD